jgi:hypothetical protein
MQLVDFVPTQAEDQFIPNVHPNQDAMDEIRNIREAWENIDPNIHPDQDAMDEIRNIREPWDQGNQNN